MSDEAVLVVTGKRAGDLVRKYSARSEVETEVKVLPIEIASFMNAHHVLNGLKDENLEGFTTILVPGQSEFDMETVEEELGVPVFKGPNHAADIPLVLDNFEELELSKELPASKLLAEKAKDLAERQLSEIEEKALQMADKDSNFKLGSGEGSIMVGQDFPPRVVAEINNAPYLTEEELVDQASRYLEEGADIIDIGMSTEGDNLDELREAIEVLRKNFDVPLSIDTTDESEIDAALEEGIDMVVSIDGSTIESFEGMDVPAVIIPRDPEENYHPREAEEKFEFLSSLLERAKALGYERPIADPILEPLKGGFSSSFSTLYRLREADPDIPVFMGIGNVIELFDADSIGMSALLMGIASELDVNFVLCVEASDKTRRNVSEVVSARDMMTLARDRNTVPKDLGIDLLRYKEKVRRLDPYDSEIEKDSEVIEATPVDESYENLGEYFRIFVGESKIIAVFYSSDSSNVVVKGETSEEVCAEILKRGLVSEPSHAAYLGRELKKAEIALKTGKGYVQEDEVFSFDDRGGK